MFDVALYTDTRASEAIDGIDGFNFQAISEGMNAQDRQVIRDTLLHRVVVGWNADHDPLDHPPSFAYCGHAGRYYLSRGISTGVTNNGRPGNLLTQAIATSDPDDFGMMRPAQLFGALNWRLEKAPGQRIDRWPSPLAITPEYEAEALRDMIRADAWAVEHFAQFLTMVEEVTSDNPKRLVVITADEAVATRWIALGTLFVETTRALSLSIRGLVPDPMTTKADIVAASPDFGPQPDPSVVRAGVTIIDLDRRVLTPITPTEVPARRPRRRARGDRGRASMGAVPWTRPGHASLSPGFVHEGTGRCRRLGHSDGNAARPGGGRTRRGTVLLRGSTAGRRRHLRD